MDKDKDLHKKGGRISTLLKAMDMAEVIKVSRAIAYNLMLRGKSQQSGWENVGESDLRI
jgi:hypothetical protein